MNITALNKAVGKVNRISPIKNMVWVKVEKDIATLSTFDGFSQQIPCPCDDMLETVYQWSDLKAILKVIKNPLFSVGEIVHAETGLTLPIKPVEGFYERYDRTGAFNDCQEAIGYIDLLTLKKLATCMAKNDVRYYLNGVLFDFDNKTVVSTDGHRMYKGVIDVVGNCKGRFIVRNETINIMLAMKRPIYRVAFDKTGLVHVENENGIELTQETMDGRFPDYERVIPDNPYSVNVNVKDMLRTLKQIKPAIKKCVAVSFTDKGLTFAVDGNSEPLASIKGDCLISVVIGFNLAYMEDAFKHLKNESTTIEYKDWCNSILIDKSSVVMPCRL